MRSTSKTKSFSDNESALMRHETYESEMIYRAAGTLGQGSFLQSDEKYRISNLTSNLTNVNYSLNSDESSEEY